MIAVNGVKERIYYLKHSIMNVDIKLELSLEIGRAHV